MLKTISLVTLAMFAFAANSLLCRMALAHTDVDPVSFTVARIAGGAWALLIFSYIFYSQFAKNKGLSTIDLLQRGASVVGGISLFAYAALFSFAYINMSTGAGALLLFGSVQLTMLSAGKMKGETFGSIQSVGIAIAFVGLIILLLPSTTTPPLGSAVMMVLAGIAWGIYSIKGKKSKYALITTAGNFVYAGVLCALMLIVLFVTNTLSLSFDINGLTLALLSGVFASACGYAIWYSVLPLLTSSTAATIQLSVPVIATFMGWVILSEKLTLQIMIASLVTLGGISLTIKSKTKN